MDSNHRGGRGRERDYNEKNHVTYKNISDIFFEEARKNHFAIRNIHFNEFLLLDFTLYYSLFSSPFLTN